MAGKRSFASAWKKMVAGIVVGLGFATAALPAHAEDGLCVVSALVFDADLNSLGLVATAEAVLTASNPLKACARDKALGTSAANAACQMSADARFVAIVRRADGVDVINSRDSQAKFSRKGPVQDKATIKLRSCDFWLAEAQRAR